MPVSSGKESVGWMFVSPELVPERLRARSEPVLMVPMLAEEVTAVLDGRRMELGLGPGDERLVALVARGRSVSAIAKELGMSLRGVQRRLAQLRRRFGAGSTAELAAFLSRKGF
jgi:DNA-binding NarL/FixJ family response regulator